MNSIIYVLNYNNIKHKAVYNDLHLYEYDKYLWFDNNIIALPISNIGSLSKILHFCASYRNRNGS